MELKDIKLKKGMSIEEINELIGEWIELSDDVYLGNAHKHNWKCKCGNTIEGRIWNKIRPRMSIKCKSCLINEQESRYKNYIEHTKEYEYIKTFKSGEVLPNGDVKNKPHIQIRHIRCGNIYEIQASNFVSDDNMCKMCNSLKREHRYKYEVEKTGEYKYIRSFKRGEMLPNGKMASTKYIQIKHIYCSSIYEIQAAQFVNYKRKCMNCCNEYENSFAHHIEVELGEPLESYWDFEKNTVNPYHISKGTDTFKIWIKCTNKDYHESYETDCYSFVTGNRCPYCASRKVHPKDSFAQYHIDNTDKYFLEKYWDYDKNTVDPFEISPKSSILKIWIKCQEKDYHDSYEVSCSNFSKGRRCSYCRCIKVHPLDSFGQYLKENNLFHLWSNRNTIDPFLISKNCSSKVYMLCDKKDYHNDYGGYFIECNNFVIGRRCSYCSRTKLHLKDSFGYNYFDLIQSWSFNNSESPFYVPCKRGSGYKFICPKCGLEFSRKISNAANRGVLCSECSMSKGEKRISEWLKRNNIIYSYEKEFEGLVGVNEGSLSYDFYIQDYNLLIEYQGEFHDGSTGFQTDKQLKRQQEHDRRKRQYAKDNNIELLEIWYSDLNNIEEILNTELINSNKLI